ncbi:MAG: preprotein translocase subunit YajC [Candidatus Marinimicrobia bacterium]|nr:preprotein translocase subunit YajC [Candidatus Neomarinimicrobiota bacterium]|tara:strand:- start:246 stop:536 length:291 start_codon:yes stop_codon:yes gene_type:complete
MDASNLGFLGSIIPFILMFLIMYFLIIRPQRKQQKDFDLMIENLKKGDRILTRGGIYCVVLDFLGEDKEKILVDLGSNVKIQISKNYVSALIKKNK